MLLSVVVLGVWATTLLPSASGCSDLLTTCNRVGHLCDDKRIGETIRLNCEETCRRCPKGRPHRPPSHHHRPHHKPSRDACADMSKAKCREWKRKGFCHSNEFHEATKAHVCPMTCGFCKKRRKHPHPTKPHPPTKPPTKPNPTKPPPPKTKPQPPISKPNPPTTPNPPEPRYPESEFAYLLGRVDESVDACTDFYQFTCNKYNHDHHGIKEEFGTIGDIEIGTWKEMKELINTNSHTNSKAVDTMRQFLQKCGEEGEIERLRTTELRTIMEEVAGSPMLVGPEWDTLNFSPTNVILGLESRTIGKYLFEMNPVQFSDGNVYPVIMLGDTILEDPNAYSDPTHYNAVRDLMIEVMKIVHHDSKSKTAITDIEPAVDRTLDFEKKLAQLHIEAGRPPVDSPEIEMRSEKLDDTKLNTRFSSIEWPLYFYQTVLFPEPLRNNHPTVYAYDPPTFDKYGTLTRLTPQRVLVDYLFIRMVLHNIPYLDSRFTAARRKFEEKYHGLRPALPREQVCAESIVRHFPLVMDHLFVEKEMRGEQKRTLVYLLDQVQQSTNKMVERSKLFDAFTTKKAILKLKNIEKVVGAVKEALSEGDLDSKYLKLGIQPSDSFRRMAQMIELSTRQRDFLGLLDPKTFDGAEQYRSMSAVPANIIEENTIGKFGSRRSEFSVVPAGAANTPLMNISLPSWLNYGAVGFFLGRELIHGIGAKGSKYNADGRSGEWWDAQTKQEFDKRVKCMQDGYSKEVDTETKQTIDGKETLAQNIADHGGIRAAFEAFKLDVQSSKPKNVGKYTPEQMFFIMTGYTMCGTKKVQPLGSLRKRWDFAPNDIRVNEVMAHFDEFAKAFQCKPNAKLNPPSRCSVW